MSKYNKCTLYNWIINVNFLYHFPPQATENIPESTVSAIFHLCLDFPFSLTFPSIHESAVAYLEQSNSENHGLYSRVSQAANTMEATCSFLKEVQAKVMLRKKNPSMVNDINVITVMPQTSVMVTRLKSTFIPALHRFLLVCCHVINLFPSPKIFHCNSIWPASCFHIFSRFLHAPDYNFCLQVFFLMMPLCISYLSKPSLLYQPNPPAGALWPVLSKSFLYLLDFAFTAIVKQDRSRYSPLTRTVSFQSNHKKSPVLSRTHDSYLIQFPCCGILN